ncbi:MAG: hypothetical protein CMK30_07410 [Porticoccaceae bacterium]|nr:hypothetical protein [Porticoccaceae bacterium]
MATEIANLFGFSNTAFASAGILDVVGLSDDSPSISLYVILEAKAALTSVRDTVIISFQGATNTSTFQPVRESKTSLF